MKKLFFTLCALCVSVSTWALQNNATAWTDSGRDAATVYEDANNTGLYFYISGTDAVLTWSEASTSNYSSLTSLTIPGTVVYDGVTYPVTKVGDYAFYDAATIEGEVVIPANILNLGISAFENSTKITAVTIEYSETAINETNNQLYGCSFYGCSGITTVTMNREVGIARGDSDNNHIYRISPFSDLTSIQTIYIGEHVTSIPYNMFNCNNTTSCSLQTVYCYATSMIPTLGYYAFGAHTDLTLYVYNELVESFKNDTQTYSWPSFCSNIVGMGDMPTTLEDGTYKDVETGLYFELDEDGNASIYHDEAGIYTDDNLVAHSTITGAYTLPEQVSADGETYYDVTRVEASAFNGANIQGHLVIPAHITALGINAFANCTGIAEVTFEYSTIALKDESNTNNQGTETFLGCTKVETVNLYRDIDLSLTKSICGPFCTTYAIKTLNIGPRVTALGDYLFHYAFSTSSTPVINCYAPVPFQLGYYSFDTGGSYTFNVPNGAATAYSTLEAASSNHTAWNQSGTFYDMSDAFAITTHDNGEGTAYATFYNSASNVELFDGELTAYQASTLENEGSELIIDINSLGSVIPAATGVIVETQAEGTYLAIATTKEATAATNNHLYGETDENGYTVAPNDGGSYLYYLLSSSNGQVGFYWGADNGGAFQCQAHRAYLALEQDAVNESSGISIRKGNGGEDTTGISSVESATEGATVKGIYTVQGVRVSNMNQPGLYIVDGRKVLVK